MIMLVVVTVIPLIWVWPVLMILSFFMMLDEHKVIVRLEKEERLSMGQGSIADELARHRAYEIGWACLAAFCFVICTCLAVICLSTK